MPVVMMGNFHNKTIKKAINHLRAFLLSESRPTACVSGLGSRQRPHHHAPRRKIYRGCQYELYCPGPLHALLDPLSYFNHDVCGSSWWRGWWQRGGRFEGFQKICFWIAFTLRANFLEHQTNFSSIFTNSAHEVFHFVPKGLTVCVTCGAWTQNALIFAEP